MGRERYAEDGGTQSRYTVSSVMTSHRPEGVCMDVRRRDAYGRASFVAGQRGTLRRGGHTVECGFANVSRLRRTNSRNTFFSGLS